MGSEMCIRDRVGFKSSKLLRGLVDFYRLGTSDGYSTGLRERERDGSSSTQPQLLDRPPCSTVPHFNKAIHAARRQIGAVEGARDGVDLCVEVCRIDGVRRGRGGAASMAFGRTDTGSKPPPGGTAAARAVWIAPATRASRRRCRGPDTRRPSAGSALMIAARLLSYCARRRTGPSRRRYISASPRDPLLSLIHI